MDFYQNVQNTSKGRPTCRCLRHKRRFLLLECVGFEVVSFIHSKTYNLFLFAVDIRQKRFHDILSIEKYDVLLAFSCSCQS